MMRLARKINHVTGVTVPGGLAAGYKVIQATHLRALQCHANGMGGDICQQISPGGGADLVVDYFQSVTFLCQFQHGFGKVTATRRINPTGAKDEMPTARGADGFFAFPLGFAIDTEWGSGVGFLPKFVAAAVKNVVGGIMNQPRTDALGFLSENAGGDGVDGARQLWFTLGLIDGGMRCRINDDVRGDGANSLSDAFQIAEVATKILTISIQSHQFAQGRQAALQLPANLPAFAEKKDFHAARPV
jgi:hypothetical protein